MPTKASPATIRTVPMTAGKSLIVTASSSLRSPLPYLWWLPSNLHTVPRQNKFQIFRRVLQFFQRAREKTPGGQVVLRVRGSTGSLCKLTLQRECGVSWRYQAITLIDGIYD